jgi:predicted nucleic acid-binding protein
VTFMAGKPAKVFLDSNVILSGPLSDQGVPRILLDLLSLGLPFLSGLTGKYNLLEIERALARKFPALAPVWGKTLPKPNLKIIPLPRAEALKPYAGMVTEKALPVLVSAVTEGAHYLATGDRHFAGMKGAATLPFRIVSPSEFVDAVMPEILKKVQTDLS